MLLLLLLLLLLTGYIIDDNKLTVPLSQIETVIISIIWSKKGLIEVSFSCQYILMSRFKTVDEKHLSNVFRPVNGFSFVLLEKQGYGSSNCLDEHRDVIDGRALNGERHEFVQICCSMNLIVVNICRERQQTMEKRTFFGIKIGAVKKTSNERKRSSVNDVTTI